MEATLTIHALRRSDTPPAVLALLPSLARWRSNGLLDDRGLADKVDCLNKEELHSRGLSLAARQLPGGTTEFFIRSTETNTTLEAIEFRSQVHQDAVRHSANERFFYG